MGEPLRMSSEVREARKGSCENGVTHVHHCTHGDCEQMSILTAKSTHNITPHAQHNSTQMDLVCNDHTQHVDDRRPFEDHGFAWVIVALSSFLIMIFYSSWASYSVYILEFQDQYANSKGFFAWVYAFSSVVAGVTGIISGPISHKYGTRTTSIIGSMFTALAFLGGAFSTNKYVLGFFYSVISGLGKNFLHVSATVATQQYFNKKRGLANGLIMMGGALALFVCPPVAAYVTKWYGWRASFLLQSGFALHGIPAGMLLRPPPAQRDRTGTSVHLLSKPSLIKRTCQELSQSCQFEVVKNIAFNLLNFGLFFFICAHETPIVFSVSRAVNFGIPRQQAAFVMSAWAISSVFGQLFLGWLGDRTTRGYVMAFGTFVAGIADIASVFCKSLPLHLTYGAFYGFFSAVVLTLNSPTFVDIVGIERLPGAQGFFLVGFGVAGLIGTPLADFLIETTKGFTAAFLVAGISSICGGLAMAFAVFFENYRKRKLKKRTVIESAKYHHVTSTQENRIC